MAFAKNNWPEVVHERMSSFSQKNLCDSAITLAELEYGVFNSSNPRQNQLALTLFLANIEVVRFGNTAAVEYGRIRAILKRKGTPIGANDPIIAAHAKSLGMKLVTNNMREFGRMERLPIED